MEITGGHFLPVNNEEQEIIRILEKEETVWRSELDEYGCSLADKMVSKGLLNRIEKDEKIGYRPNLGD